MSTFHRRHWTLPQNRTEVAVRIAALYELIANDVSTGILVPDVDQAYRSCVEARYP